MKKGLDLTIAMIEGQIENAKESIEKYKGKNVMLENYYGGRLAAFSHCLDLINVDKKMQK